jgi:hypothetical protein
MAGLSGLLPHEKWKASELPKAITKLTRRYYYTVAMQGIKPRKSGEESYFVGVSSSKLLTRAEAETQALRAISEYAEAGFEKWAQPELISGMRAGKAGTFL